MEAEWEWEVEAEWEQKNSNTNNLNIVMLIMRQASMNSGRVPFGQMKIDLKLKIKWKGWTNS